jgi:cysteine desulfurase
MIFLDYNATAPMKPAVRAAVLETMERHGNPSSVHRYGRIARRYAEDARAVLAAFVGVKPPQVIFTSGGTEANNMVLRGVNCAHFITSAIEHDSVLATTPTAERLPVNGDGIVDLASAERILKSAPAQSLVSVMLVNNETGVIQPVAEIARLAKAYGHLIHTDAIQAVGRLPIDFTALDVDFLTLSAHKIGGPQGMGALIIADKMTLIPLISGGGQEMNRRAGTENVAGIVGFGVAAQLAADDLLNVPQMANWRDQLQSQLWNIAGRDAVILGAKAPRVANTICIAMRNVTSETQVMAMDLAGVAVSAGSACSSGKVKDSHVLRAMVFADDVAGSALRISLGWETQMADIERCIDAWRALYQRTHGKQQSEAA